VLDICNWFIVSCWAALGRYRKWLILCWVGC